MKGSEQGLAVLSTAIVLLWMGGYLAYAGRLSLAPTEPMIALAPVHPAPTPEPAPPAPRAPIHAEVDEPDVEDSEATAIAPEPVGEAGLAMGRELLSSGGAFPALNATYEDFGSFHEYARSMLRLGARFVVVRDHRIVGAADVETGALSNFEFGAAFSPIPRDYSHEPALARLGDAVRKRYGPGSRVKMLLPRDLDAALFGGIALVLAARGEAPDAYSEIQGRYEPATDGRVWFRVESGTRSDGASVALPRLLDLSALAAKGSRT